MTKRANVKSYVIPIVAAVLGGIAAPIYSEMEAWISPDTAFGNYTMLKASDEPNSAPVREYVSLNSHDGSVWGVGRSGTNRWSYRGFLKVGYLVLTYRSEGPKSIGFGEFLLEQKTADGSEYVGRMRGNFCPERAIMQCDAVLIKSEPAGKEEEAALVTYKGLLGRQCTIDRAAEKIAASDCGG